MYSINCILKNIPEDCNEFVCIDKEQCPECNPDCDNYNQCKKCNFNASDEE